jgi:hypothetical protein
LAVYSEGYIGPNPTRQSVVYLMIMLSKSIPWFQRRNKRPNRHFEELVQIVHRNKMLTDIRASNVAVCKTHCQILRPLYVLSHSRTPLGRVVHKGYSSRHLTANNCKASGFGAGFQFRGLWVASRIFRCFTTTQRKENVITLCTSLRDQLVGRIFGSLRGDNYSVQDSYLALLTKYYLN